MSHLLLHSSVCIASLSVFIYNCYLAQAKWLGLRAELQSDGGQAILKFPWYLTMSESPRTLGVGKLVRPTVEDRMDSTSLPPVCSVQKAPCLGVKGNLNFSRESASFLTL